MARIAVLSEQLVNKIAAGEVVERPASVVKELCENALDAGARNVRVSVAGGGLGRIAVSDDGSGMSREDALLSLTRHATSKLKDLEGLFAISTMGFRGEALPAIAAVSRFTLTTAEPGAAVGTRIEVEGGKPPAVVDAAAADGTQVVVEDLFFNTPARRKFMRRESTEKKHCEEAVVRLALAHPEVGFFFEADGRSALAIRAGAPVSERIAAALGKEAGAHLLPFEERRLGIHVRGQVASPSFHLPNARGVYTFVNRRYVRDRGLNYALQRGFQDALPPGRQPVAVVEIELDPAAVDVNVHPQKLEVRFADAQGVYEAVLSGVRRGLQAAVARPAAAGVAEEATYASAVQRFLDRAREEPGAFASPFVRDAPVAEGARLGFGQARPDLNQAPPPGYFSQLEWLGALGRRFWVCEGRGATLVVVDPHAARERVALDQYRRATREGAATAQRSLFGASVELSAEEAKALAAALPALAALGVDAEPFGGTSIALKAVPRGLEGIDARAFLSDLAQALPNGQDAALRVLACHAARAPDREPSREECAALFAHLDGAREGLDARHAAVVVTEVPFLELERRASR